VDKSKSDEARRNLEEMLRETDRIRADAQKSVEFARRNHSPERRRRDRRTTAAESGSTPERRLSDRRR
jgi:hypothetical protein